MDFYKSIIESSPAGYAYHRIILDANNHPCDYEFIEANIAFENCTGLKRSNILGKKVSEVLPELQKSGFDWIQFYGNIAVNGGRDELKQFSEPLNRWYRIIVYSPEKYYFITHFIDITTEKNQIERLKHLNIDHAAQKKYDEQLLNTIPSAVFTVDKDCCITSWNKRAEVITGYTSTEVIGKHCAQFSLEPCKSSCGLMADHVKKPVTGAICKIKNKLGAILTISKNIDILRDHQGEIVGGIECFEDITDRIEAESVIVKQAGFITCLLDSIPDIIFFKDTDGVYLGCNPPFAEFVGKPREQIIGKTDYELFDQVSADFYRYHDNELLKESSSFRDEDWAMYPDGRKILFDTLKTLYRDQNGNILGILGVSRDVTERKQIELTLKESEINFRTLFETMDDMIFVGNPQGKLLYTNWIVSQKLGYTKEELQNMHIIDLHPLELRGEAQQIISNVYAGKLNSCPLPLLKKDASFVPVETRVWFGKWDGQDCIFGISKDLTIQQAALDKFHKLFDNNPALMAVIGLTNKKFVEVNAAFLNKLGFSKDEVIGKAILEIGLFENESQVYALEDKLFKEGRLVNIEIQVRKKDGQFINGLCSGEIVDNQIEKAFLLVMTDITDKKIAEKQLQASEEMFRLLFEHMTNGFSLQQVVLNEQGEPVDFIYLMVNKAFENQMHRRAEDIIGKSILELNPATDRRLIQQYCHVGLSGEPLYTEFFSKSLNKHFTVFSFSPQKGFFAAVFEDITQRKQMEDEIAKISGRLKLATQAANVGIWEYDILRNALVWDDAMYKLYGVNAKTFSGAYETWENGLHPDDLEISRQHLNDAIDGLKDFNPLFRVVWQDGSIHHIKANAAVFHDEQGNPIKMIGTNWDVTETVQRESDLLTARLQAETASLMKSQFLANMSHEIRTPMNGIFGFLELLQTSNLSSEQKEYIREAKSASIMLLNLINDILDLSKIEAGKLSLEKIQFNLRTAIEDAVSLLAPKAAEKNLDLHVMIKAGVPEEVIGDPSRLRQILSNLINNAVKFTESGEVSVMVDAIEKEHDMVMLKCEVKDTGIGIPKESIDKLFQSFSQADASTTRKYGGTGLGLAISKELVNLMDGEIRVESIPGEGSTFCFTVFMKITKRAVEKKLEYEKLEGLNILIVDDSSNNRKIIHAYLQGTGLNVFEAKDAGSAMATIMSNANTKSNISIAIIDYQMPGMNGYELANALKNIPLAQDIKLILLTSAAQKGDKSAAQEHGFCGYLTKPVKRDELVNCIAIVMGLHQVVDTPEPVVTKYTVQEVKNAMKPRILMVEDNQINRKVVIGMLKSHEMTCDVAVNGAEAVKAVAEKTYDLVLMDCQMPVLDGYAATMKIREQEENNKHTIIIAMTANAMEGDKIKCLQAGMDDYISKPIDYEKLFQLITSYTKQQKQDAVQVDLINDNIDLFVESTGILKEEAKEVFLAFIAHLPNLFEGIQEAMEQNDFGQMGKLVHQLKGTSGNLRVTNIYELSQKLEDAIRRQDKDDCARLFKEIQEMIH